MRPLWLLTVIKLPFSIFAALAHKKPRAPLQLYYVKRPMRINVFGRRDDPTPAPGATPRSGRARLLFEKAKDSQYLRHVGLGLGKRWDLAAVSIDGLLAGIVGREREANVVAEALDQETQILRAGA